MSGLPDLEDGAGERERGAGEQGRDRARQAQLVDDEVRRRVAPAR
ncbi:hypothetical protein ACFWOG_07370 [Kitasatospora sp. NPDC058406]